MSVTFAQARVLVEADLAPIWTEDDGTLMTTDYGAEDETHWRIVYGAKEFIIDNDHDYIFYDAPARLVSKKTGEVTLVAWDDPRLDKMSPVGKDPDQVDVLMGSLAEWQAQVDEDFPHGASVSRSDWNDSDGNPYLYRTAAATVTEISELGMPVVHVWLDDEFEKDAYITVLAYEKVRDTPRQVKLCAPEKRVWLLSANIPPKIYNTDSWKALREAQRTLDLKQEISPELAAKVGLDS